MPSTEMRLLLRAAVAPGPAAWPAWNRWLASVDFERLEPGATALLSLVNRNLPGLPADGSIERRVRGVYRQTWTSNRFAWERTTSLLAEVEVVAAAPLLLGGAALLPAYCHDWGARPFGAMELALPVGAAGATRDLLASTGWAVGHVTPALIARTEAGLVARWHAQRADGTSLTVRWHVLEGIHAGVVDEQMLGASQLAMIGSSSVMLLHPADALIERLWHARREEHFGWIADVVQLARSLAGEANADARRDLARFAARADRLGISRPLVERLDLVMAVVPDPSVRRATDALRAHRVAPVSRLWTLPRPVDHVGRSLAGHCAGQGLCAGVRSVLRARLSAHRLRARRPVSARRS
jgi:hypothetical protein